MTPPKRLLAFAMLAAAMWPAIMAGIDELPVTEHNGTLCHYYQVQPKETIYSLCNRFGITTDEFLAANPEAASGLKAYSTLYFPVSREEWQASTVTHTVAKGETVYGLSKKYGISTAMLLDQNPQARDGLKAGQVLTLTIPSRLADSASDATPTPAAKEPEAPAITYTAEPELPVMPPTAEPEPKPEQFASLFGSDYPDDDDEADQDAVATSKRLIASSDTIRVAVMLPFMLTESSPSKQTLRYTEFFKGFLLAADSLHRRGNPVDIYAFDTQGSLYGVNAILARPELESMHLIVGPDKADQLEAVGRFAREHSIPVLNCYVVGDTTWRSNPWMMQANMPHTQMYDRAISGLLYNYDDYTPVIVSREGGDADHRKFIDQLKLRLRQKGLSCLELSFHEKLRVTDLEKFRDGNYVFIPISGKQTEINKIIPAVADLRDSLTDPDAVFVFGYPEWITYRGETLANMEACNTVVYSRFYNDTDDIDSRAFDDAFRHAYGEPMDSAVPQQGLMGFDAGWYIINALRTNRGDFDERTPPSRGLQNGFSMRRADGPDAGWSNDVLYLVNFRPSGLVDKKLIQ